MFAADGELDDETSKAVAADLERFRLTVVASTPECGAVLSVRRESVPIGWRSRPDLLSGDPRFASGYLRLPPSISAENKSPGPETLGATHAGYPRMDARPSDVGTRKESRPVHVQRNGSASPSASKTPRSPSIRSRSVPARFHRHRDTDRSPAPRTVHDARMPPTPASESESASASARTVTPSGPMLSAQAASSSLQRNPSLAGSSARRAVERRGTKHVKSSSTPSAANAGVNGATSSTRPTGRQLGVDAVDGRLVRLAPAPHRQRRRPRHERPALQVGRCRLERRDQSEIPRLEPVGQLIVLGPAADDLFEPPGADLGARVGHVAGGPAVDAAEVADHVASHPVGARRHRRVGRHHAHRGRHARAFLAQHFDGRDLHGHEAQLGRRSFGGPSRRQRRQRCR